MHSLWSARRCGCYALSTAPSGVPHHRLRGGVIDVAIMIRDDRFKFSCGREQGKHAVRAVMLVRETKWGVVVQLLVLLFPHFVVRCAPRPRQHKGHQLCFADARYCFVICIGNKTDARHFWRNCATRSRAIAARRSASSREMNVRR
mmetsp:Transcript_30021/g.92650  ORF Transcript_30021/g.92650 Transcript_30021/m.92650 type:complete len:146 (+) Transcript_30021:324-761(+)